MPLRTWLTRTVLGAVILVTALVSVGLTAPVDGPFSIAVEPVLFRLDAAAIAQSRARALGVDVHVKIGSMRLHLEWSALPISAMTTKATPAVF